MFLSTIGFFLSGWVHKESAVGMIIIIILSILFLFGGATLYAINNRKFTKNYKNFSDKELSKNIHYKYSLLTIDILTSLLVFLILGLIRNYIVIRIIAYSYPLILLGLRFLISRIFKYKVRNKSNFVWLIVSYTVLYLPLILFTEGLIIPVFPAALLVLIIYIASTSVSHYFFNYKKAQKMRLLL